MRVSHYGKCLKLLVLVAGFSLTWGVSDTEHRTKAATEKQYDLWCYRCDTMWDGEHCLEVSDNSSSFHMKCHKEHRKCQVKRISVSTSTEDTTGKPKLWLLQRNCSETCEPGCIIIGERTKLHSCITCCETSFCNVGSGSERYTAIVWLILNGFMSLMLATSSL